MDDIGIFDAARLNNPLQLQRIASLNLNDLNERNDSGATALHICATYGCLEAAKMLLKYGADAIIQDFESGWTPLHRSIYHNHFKLSILFIRHMEEKVASSSKHSPRTIPYEIEDNDGLTPLQLLAMTRSTHKLDVTTTHGCVFAFGKADFQLGVSLPNAGIDITKPKFVRLPESATSVLQISASKYHSMCVTSSGSVYSWGHGRSGRLGHGDEMTQPLPRIISTFNLLKVRIERIAVGQNHSLAVSSAGQTFSWG